jgi:glucose/mannose-6-phosphate isomerase
VIDLDDEGLIRAGDPSQILATIGALADHCREGYRLGLDASPVPSGEGVTSVAFCGMGGSAIAGDVVRALYSDRLRIPVVVVRDAELPEFVGPHTLVLASSYSGDTVEALACFEEAVARGARVASLTSGGELLRRSDELDLAHVRLPGGFMPRAALGYITLGAIGVLEAVGLVPPMSGDLEEALGELAAQDARCAPGVPASVNPAKALAAEIEDRVPVIWGAEGIGAVAASRWKAQCNENAKVPAFAGSLPELDHNEVVGWSQGQGRRFFVIALRQDSEQPDVAARFPLSMQIASDAGAEVREVWSGGRSGLARFLTLAVTGDYTSTYLAIARGVDPAPIDAIARLKQALADA